MTVSTPLELKIQNISYENLLDMLRSVPSIFPILSRKSIQSYTIIFTADGLPEHSSISTKESSDQYFAECEKRKVMPFTEVNLRYSPKVGMFLPKTEEYCSGMYLTPISPPFNVAREKMDGLIRGGRLSQITVYGSELYQKDNYLDFISGALNPLTSKGYRVSSGRIVPGIEGPISSPATTFGQQGEIYFSKDSIKLTHCREWKDKTAEAIDSWFRAFSK